jgi:hypothetical protein
MSTLPTQRIGAAAAAALAAAAVGCGWLGSEASPEDEAHLARGWSAFLDGLEGGRENVRDPWRLGEGPGGRELAEGHRYLLGHLARIIERETLQHPDLPYFQRSVRMLSKWTIDNPDTLYLTAPIAPEGTYRITGRAADTTGWRTGARAGLEPKAPRVVTFQTTTAMVGQTGSLEEFATCRNQTLGAVRHFEIEPDAAGRFEILVAPERPAGHDGPFLPTRATLDCTDREGNTETRERVATQVNVREIFSDWDRETALELDIARIDVPTPQRPPTDPQQMGEALERIGTRLENQIRFWNGLHELGLEVLGDRNLDGRRNLPLNGINPPAPPFIAGGTAGAGQLYAAGTFDLARDQALLVRVEAPNEPYYQGFQLANLWGESLDQASYVSSLTASQLPPASDGARYYVVAHEDPGVPGWLDTTGLRQGTLSMRFVYETAPDEAALPRAAAELVPLDEVRARLPADTPQIDPATRREQIARRQAHIRRRFRQY